MSSAKWLDDLRRLHADAQDCADAAPDRVCGGKYECGGVPCAVVQCYRALPALLDFVAAVREECERKCGCNPYGPLDTRCRCFDDIGENVVDALGAIDAAMGGRDE